MITLLTGNNSFEIQRAVSEMEARFDGRSERFDGTELTIVGMSDLLRGSTLFADKRMVIIKDLSENKALWSALPGFLLRPLDDVELILVEPKPDRRTKTYKDLQNIATVREFGGWGERDAPKAEAWLLEEATRQGVDLDRQNARTLVARVGVDQWLLSSALQKLAVVDVISPAIIEDIIEMTPSENVFYLLETALRGDSSRLSQMITTLEKTDDPYRLFGLLSGQVFQLAALVVTDTPPAQVAKDFGVHPYAMTQMAKHSRSLSRQQIKKIVAIFKKADADMKTSAADPWILLGQALMKVAAIA